MPASPKNPFEDWQRSLRNEIRPTDGQFPQAEAESLVRAPNGMFPVKMFYGRGLYRKQLAGVCVRCQNNPRKPGQRWCKACFAAYQRQYRATVRQRLADLGLDSAGRPNNGE